MINDTYNIAPHILTHSDGRVLCLPTDAMAPIRKGIAVFANRPIAEEMAPGEFRPVYCGPAELEELAEALHIWFVVIIGLGGDLEGSVLPLDAFVGVLLGEM